MDDSKPASSGSCSEDLDRAKDLSRQLKGAAQGPGLRATGSSPYVSFPKPEPAAPVPPGLGRAPAPGSRPSLPLMPRREPLKAPVSGFGPQAWNRLLDACVAAVAAESAFIMDPNGLVVSSRGPRANEELEAVGARLMVAFDQADRIEGSQGTLSMTVETPRGSLHGLRLRQADGSVLTLGLVVPSGLTAERQARVLALVTAAGAETSG